MRSESDSDLLCRLLGRLVRLDVAGVSAFVVGVRRSCVAISKRNSSPPATSVLSLKVFSPRRDHLNPETRLLKKADNELLRQALEELPAEFREVIVLRELEGLSYKQIADVAEIPVGTVMSRLARARKRLQQALLVAGTKRRQEIWQLEPFDLSLPLLHQTGKLV